MRNGIDCLRLSLCVAEKLKLKLNESLEKVGHASNMLIIAQAAKRDKLDDVPLSLPLQSPPQAISCGILIETILWHAAGSLAGGLHAGQLVGLLVYIILRFLNDFKTLTNALWILDKYPPPPTKSRHAFSHLQLKQPH